MISLCREAFSHFQGALGKAKHILQRHKTFNYILELRSKSKFKVADSEALKCVMWHADLCDEQQPPIYSGHGQNMQRKDEG